MKLDMKDEWQTPKEFFSYCNGVFGPFTIDAAATPGNALVERFWTKRDNALSKSWVGEIVWCNPPYSDIEPWVLHAANARHYYYKGGPMGGSVLLLPSSTGAAWFHRTAGVATTYLLRSRLKFTRPDRDGDNPRHDNMLMVFPGSGYMSRLNYLAGETPIPDPTFLCATASLRPRSTASR